VVEGIQSEFFWLLCPELANRREATKALEALGEVVSIEEGRQMRTEAIMGS
jgi:hypothetical protein